MESYRTEEEQIAVLKKWWKDNGNSLIVTLLIALTAVFGWRAYQTSIKNEAANASVLFSQLLEVQPRQIYDEVSEEDQASAIYLSQQLMDDYSSSTYAIFAALFQAKTYVKQEKYDEAKLALEWILAQTEDANLTALTSLRLARVLSANQEHEAASAILDGKFPEGYQSLVLDIKGDVYARQGMVDKAIESYQAAYESLEQDSIQKGTLKVKLADLGVKV